MQPADMAHSFQGYALAARLPPSAMEVLPRAFPIHHGQRPAMPVRLHFAGRGTRGDCRVGQETLRTHAFVHRGWNAWRPRTLPVLPWERGRLARIFLHHNRGGRDARAPRRWVEWGREALREEIGRASCRERV